MEITKKSLPIDILSFLGRKKGFLLSRYDSHDLIVFIESDNKMYIVMTSLYTSDIQRWDEHKAIMFGECSDAGESDYIRFFSLEDIDKAYITLFDYDAVAEKRSPKFISHNTYIDIRATGSMEQFSIQAPEGEMGGDLWIAATLNKNSDGTYQILKEDRFTDFQSFIETHNIQFK